MYSDYEERKGLDNLKNAFLLFFIGYIISWIPLVSFVGGLLVLVGLIFLILGWRDLGRSRLQKAQSHRSTANWIIFSIIGSFVIVIIAISALFSYFAQNQVLATAANPVSQQALSGFIDIILVVVVLAGILTTYAYVKVARSLRTLSNDVSQPALASAGNFLILGIAINYAGLAGFFWAVYSGYYLNALQSSFGNPLANSNPILGFFSSGLLPLAIFLFAGLIIEIIGSYCGYEGASSAIRKIGFQYSPYYGESPPIPPLTPGNSPNAWTRSIFVLTVVTKP